MNRFMSRICYVLIAHIKYLFYFYSSSYNLFINWGQTGDKLGTNWGQNRDKTCDKACDKLVTSSSEETIRSSSCISSFVII